MQLMSLALVWRSVQINRIIKYCPGNIHRNTSKWLLFVLQHTCFLNGICFMCSKLTESVSIWTVNFSSSRWSTDVRIIFPSQVSRNHQPAEKERTLPEFKTVDPAWCWSKERSGPGRGKVRYVGGYMSSPSWKTKIYIEKISSMLLALGREKEIVYFMKRKTLFGVIKCSREKLNRDFSWYRNSS